MEKLFNQIIRGQLQGEILAKFPNFGLYSKLSPKDLCQADFLGLARMAQFSNLVQSKIGNILHQYLGLNGL